MTLDAVVNAPPLAAPSAPAPFSLLRVAFFVLAGWAVMAWPWLSGAVTVPWDSKAHFQPQLQFLAQSLHRGESPFWAPFVFAGHPQVADPQSLIFSPPFWLLALVNPAPSLAAMDAVSFAALLVGALAIVLYFRDRGWAETGAIVAALAFAFGGAAAWRIQHVGQVISLAWFPIALLLLDRALRRGSLGYGFASGVAAGFMLLGRDQVAYLGLVTLALYAPVALLSHRPMAATLKRAWRPLSAGALGGALTVTVPVILTLMLAADSNRPAISLDDAGKGSLHPASLLTGLIPHLYGIALPLADYWGPPSPDWGPVDLFLARNMATFYFGLLPVLGLIMLPFARVARGRAELAFFALGFLVFMLYALGRYTPVFGGIFSALPGVDLFRRPADALFNACALGAIAGGYVIGRWTEEGGFRRIPLALKLLAAAAFIACLATGAWLAISVNRLSQASIALAAATLFLAATLLVLASLGRLRGRHWLAGLVVTLTMTADLGWNNAPNESTGLVTDTYDVLRSDTLNPTIAELKRRLAATAGPDRIDRVELAGVDFHWPNASLVHGLHHTLGYNPVRSALYSASYGAGDHIPGPKDRRFTPLVPGYRSPLVDVAGLRFIVSRVPLTELDPTARPEDFPEVARTDDGVIYENPRALPRVLVADGVEAVDGPALVASGPMPALDYRRTVLLERADGAVGRPAEGEPGTARLAGYANTRIVVATESPRDAFLVLHDAWHPWWTATVDGRPAPILKANITFRAVAIPAGRAEVVFQFRPFSGAVRQLMERRGR